MSLVTCQMSGVGVRCQVSGANKMFFNKMLELVGGGFVINGTYRVDIIYPFSQHIILEKNIFFFIKI